MRDIAAEPKPDQIAELERVVRRDTTAVIAIHEMLMKHQGSIADPLSDAYAREIDCIQAWLSGEAGKLEHELKQAKEGG